MEIPLRDYLRIKVIPKSAKTEIADILETEEGKTIKIRIKATPERGKANAELISFLSKKLKINKSQIKIISGAYSQIKLIKVERP